MSTSAEPELNEAGEEKPPINLEVTVEKPQACLRQVVVTIPQSEVERYMKDAYDDLVPEAQVPGFRPGRAPRKLVEKQFRDRVVDQVKGSLLMDSLSQVTDSEDFSAISEPDFAALISFEITSLAAATAIRAASSRTCLTALCSAETIWSTSSPIDKMYLKP